MATNIYDRPDFYRLRFEVDGIKYAIVQQLTDHEVQLSRAVKAAVERFFEKEAWIADLDGMIVEEVRGAIKRAVRESVERVLREPDVSSILGEAIKAGMKESMARAVGEALGG